MTRARAQALIDFLLAPLRLFVFSNRLSERLSLTSLELERMYAVLPEVRGRLLDVGCGPNRLVQLYRGEGIGVDVHDHGCGAMIVDDSSVLPFEDGEFDTVTFVASLNHIPYRQRALEEAGRLLNEEGRLVITMINPVLGWVNHRLFWRYKGNKEALREKNCGETLGLWKSNVISLCSQCGFRLLKSKRFLYGLNRVYVFAKNRQELEGYTASQ